MKNGVICLGEALIDFIPLDDNNETFQKSPGGAPANVAVGLARLGAKAVFLGKVGDDVLGRFLKETLDNYGVDTSAMTFTRDVRTGVVFVTLGDGGERSFEFYIDPSADRFLEPEDIPQQLFDENNVLHVGSISMISEPSRSATLHAVQEAKANGMLISYDPNLRLGLWGSEADAKEGIRTLLGEADVLKLSEEELEFLTGETDIEAGVSRLDAHNIPLILVTLGADGSWVFIQGEAPVHVPAQKVDAVDTTGAGDAFVSGMLYQLHLLKQDIRSLSPEKAAEMAGFAAVSGALAASTKGAMTALPTLEQVKTYREEKA
ncbi:aminoimidazole riboside kinase [Alkalicoccus luteus]|uniref:Aminoimidazole riboside kinase n=1 Tax=Alkalicoccus luteus TaxID=1237094 RepID=A0A969PPZ5_9BACI|nr:aminoimidazole riboside kinase [Alkalicoccus luteus]NJP38232.1 aminoimidazole riboside kinase [Alkalicoccus luteus]